MTDRLPTWYRKSVNAPSFLLLPLMMKGAPFAMIYADVPARGIDLDEGVVVCARLQPGDGIQAVTKGPAAALNGCSGLVECGMV
jgi:hypothetical protein